VVQRSEWREHHVADGGGQNILRSELNGTGTFGPQGGEQHSEIEIMRENDPAVRRREIDNLGIGGPGLTDC
jgi:hypothetical protein